MAVLKQAGLCQHGTSHISGRQLMCAAGARIRREQGRHEVLAWPEPVDRL